MTKSPKVKKAIKSLGLKQPKPKELVGHEDATKPYRFKKGDERLKSNKGSQLQIVPPAIVAKERKKMSELIAEYQHIPLAKELASALGIEGTPTLMEAVVMGTFIQAIKGDSRAVELLRSITEPEPQSPSGQPFNKDFPNATFLAPILNFKIVKPVYVCDTQENLDKKALEQAKALAGGDQ